MQEWTRNGCKTVVTEKGLYNHYCAECGRSDNDHTKQYETGYYVKEIHTTCKCGSKYSYMS